MAQDWLRNRRKIFLQTDTKDPYGNRILKDVGYDIGVFNGTEVFEPSINMTGINSDGSVTDRVYTGILFLDGKDTAMTSQIGAGWGGMKALVRA
mgnify:CR=1 FL=1